MHDQIEIIVVDPNRGEIIRHAEGERILRGFDATNGLEPELVDILRKESLEIAFDDFPKGRGGGYGWQVNEAKKGRNYELFTRGAERWKEGTSSGSNLL